MDSKIVNSILEKIDEKIKDKETVFSKEKFKEIKKIESRKKIAFIDGGQAELIKAVDFSLHFIRIAGLVFRDKEKTKTKTTEFFLLINSTEKQGKISFDAELFPVKGHPVGNLSFDSMDRGIRKGNDRAEISDIAGIIRRLNEISMAEQLCSDADIVVIDGNIGFDFKEEEKAIKSLFENADKENSIVCSIAKTSRVFLEKGGCLLRNLNEQGGKNTWYYPLKNRTIIKLNKASDYVFEFNIYQKEHLEEVLGIISGYSNDAVFPGYPYGLLLVDQVARVSNQERDFLLNIFKARAGKGWEKIGYSVNSLNSHEILDSI